MEYLNGVKPLTNLKTMYLSTGEAIDAVDISHKAGSRVERVEEPSDGIERKIKDIIPNAQFISKQRIVRVDQYSALLFFCALTYMSK